MRLEKDDAKIGLLVFLTLALFVGFIFQRSLRTIFRKESRVQVRLLSAADVAEGTEVQLQGLRVGQVEKIQLQRDRVQYHFLADLGLRTDIVLWEGTRVLVVAKPLGGSYLDLQLPPPAERREVLGPDSVLEGASGPSLATLVGDIDDLVANLNRGVDEVRGQLQARGAGVVLEHPQARAVLQNLNQALQSYRQLAEDSRGVVRQGGGFVQNLDQALVPLKQSLDQLQAELSAHQGVTGTILDRLADTLKEVEGLTRDLRAAVQQTSPDADQSLKSLDRTLRSTEELLELLKARPNRVIWGKPSQAERDAAAGKVEAARKAQGAKP
ncbi:MAG: MlaD family protein [Holophaga sp.]|nr:MlaD family protein [Holophaga sp.]